MQESGEMYLETILRLSQGIDNVRAIDIVHEMGYSKASVSRALNRLKLDGCIRVSEEGFVTLTEGGHLIASKIYERHIVLSNLLISLGVDEATALADACKIEHDISDESFDAIKRAVGMDSSK